MVNLVVEKGASKDPDQSRSIITSRFVQRSTFAPIITSA